MSVFLTLSAFGVFVLNQQNDVVLKHVIYPDEMLAVSTLFSIHEGKSIDLLESLASELIKRGLNEVRVEDQMLARSLSYSHGLTVRISNEDAIKWFRENLEDNLLQLGIIQSQEDVSSFRYNVAVRLAKIKLSAASGARDLLIKNAIDSIDEIDKGINVLVMRVREWYSIHHPTLNELVQDQDQFIQILRQCCGKISMTKDCLERAGVHTSLIEQISNAIPNDIGPDMNEADLSIIHKHAETIESMYNLRKELEAYVTSLMQVISPNITSLVGPLIGARLISLAGSLKELARKPSSTIQVYGAERALFRSLKTGTDPPKHGIIYRVPEINTAPYWQRGKIARALAGKLSIASRIDAYADRDVGEVLRQSFISRVEEIRKQNPEAPIKLPSAKSEEKPKKSRIRQERRKGRTRRSKPSGGSR